MAFRVICGHGPHVEIPHAGPLRMEDEPVHDDILLDIDLGTGQFDREPWPMIGPDDPWLAALRAVSFPPAPAVCGCDATLFSRFTEVPRS